MTPRIVDKDKKREEILRAALQVFANKGIHDFRMIEIAESAGVGKGTLYEYFRSKEELIDGSFALFLEDLLTFLRRRVGKQRNPSDQLSAFVDGNIDFFLSGQHRVELIFDLWSTEMANRAGQRIMSDLGENYRQTRDWLAQIIHQGQKSTARGEKDAEIQASLILALLDGVLFQAVLGLISLEDHRFVHQLRQKAFFGASSK